MCATPLISERQGFDVAVIGAGIAGVSAAALLAERRSVVLKSSARTIQDTTPAAVPQRCS